jgi:hypothetical protein
MDWRRGGKAPQILNFSIRWRVSVQLHAPAALTPGSELQYSLDIRLSGHQIWSGHGGEEKNSQPLLGIEPRSSSP